MNKGKKLMLSFGISAGLLLGMGTSVSSVYANATPIDSTVQGGWEEKTGAFFEQGDYLIPEIPAFRLTRSNPIHHGWRENRFQKNGLESRAVGSTTWPGVYHYTRAQMVEWRGLGRVTSDSGRVWGMGGTQAYSGWVFEGELATHIAKTFYGR